MALLRRTSLIRRRDTSDMGISQFFGEDWAICWEFRLCCKSVALTTKARYKNGKGRSLNQQAEKHKSNTCVEISWLFSCRNPSGPERPHRAFTNIRVDGELLSIAMQTLQLGNILLEFFDHERFGAVELLCYSYCCENVLVSGLLLLQFVCFFNIQIFSLVQKA